MVDTVSITPNISKLPSILHSLSCTRNLWAVAFSIQDGSGKISKIEFINDMKDVTSLRGGGVGLLEVRG